MGMLFWIWLGALVAALVLYFRQLYTTFSRRGVRSPPVIPGMGNMLEVLIQKDHFVENIIKAYNQFVDQRFYGVYQFIVPIIIVRDLDLIKQIAVKEFEHFLDHRTIIDEHSDPLFGRNLFSLKGDEWKDMRSTLSPAFTSSKIKQMLPLIVEVGDNMILALKKQMKESGKGYLDIDVKDLSTRYANDVIASCAFGLKVDSHTQKDNKFYEMGKEASTFNFRQLLLFFGLACFPKLGTILKLNLFTENTKAFFRKLVWETIQDREKRHILRPDMIHLLMEAKKGRLMHEEKTVEDTSAGFATVEESSVGKKDINRVWSNDDLTAQAVLFFIAGFETVSSAMSFLLYELAINPEAQEKLVQEIKENEAKNQGKFDYNSIQNMVYMDMVVSETLRLWAPAIALDRICTKDFNLGRPNDSATQDYIIRKGESIQIPVNAIHRDPQYFPDPEKFIPERFSEENKHNIQPFTYMPFGLGPRNCIGSRFALCEVKVMAYQLLRSLELSPGPKTTIPPVLDKSTFNLRVKGGHWLRARIRQDA